jgi:alpha-galactosidase
MPRTFTEIATVPIDPARARVYVHGWQSWSPSTTYRIGERQHRPVREVSQTMAYRPGKPLPDQTYQGEGLLVLDRGTGEGVHLWAAEDPVTEVATMRLRVQGSGPEAVAVVTADGGAEHEEDAGEVETALATWAERYAASRGVGQIRPAPTAWCSWYHYFTKVTEQDMLENLDAMDSLGLPIEVVQLDDGYQSELGDWLTLSDRFASLSDLVTRIRDRGRRVGIWVAPFLVGARSETYRDHPEWLVGAGSGDGSGPVSAGHNWNQDLYALDATHPDAAAYLTEVFSTLHGMGIDYFKIDFIYAGGLDGERHAGDVPGLVAYRQGVELIRAAIGPESYLLGCGAPILPTVGLVDAMRVSPDTAPHYEPADGDLSQPGQRCAVLTGRGRQWQHDRFWVNDPDCLIVRPAVERREEWAEHVAQVGGLVASSDRLLDLDGWGLETTKRLLGG